LASAAPELLFLGVCSTGAAYTLQTIAQKAAPATDAAIITSGESIFGAVTAAALLGERMTATAGVGAALILAAIVLVQLPLPAYGTGR
jgi:drug/metabolite transporter (DMT)-like permease